MDMSCSLKLIINNIMHSAFTVDHFHRKKEKEMMIHII